MRLGTKVVVGGGVVTIDVIAGRTSRACDQGSWPVGEGGGVREAPRVVANPVLKACASRDMNVSGSITGKFGRYGLLAVSSRREAVGVACGGCLELVVPESIKCTPDALRPDGSSLRIGLDSLSRGELWTSVKVAFDAFSVGELSVSMGRGSGSCPREPRGSDTTTFDGRELCKVSVVVGKVECEFDSRACSSARKGAVVPSGVRTKESD